MGGTCVRHGRNDTTKMYHQEAGYQKLNSYHFDQDSDQWRGPVNTIMRKN
jgi:hypothetical protein